MSPIRRRAFVLGLAAVLCACAGPQATGTSRVEPTVPPAPPSPTPQPAPTSTTVLQPTASPVPTQAPTATPVPTVTPELTPPPLTLDVRLWNGDAEVQLDGRTIVPGQIEVARGPHQVAALIDGEPVAIVDAPADGGAVDLFVPPARAGLAIMIENQFDARPQTGLPSADVVYEALAEGGITRFLAVYLTADAAVIGPVRSLRHYFAILAGDYGADLVHIGASPEGFAWRDAMNLGFLDESAGDPGVWRVRTRLAPHNAYTDSAADRVYLAQRGRQRNRRWGPLRFGADAPPGDEPATRITLGFRPWAYRVGYTWDETRARYLRTMDGTPHRDAASGEQIAPASVVVQFVAVEPVPNDDKQRLETSLVDSGGKLVVFSDGTRRAGTWAKDAARSSTRWLDAAGSPLVLRPGPVWVELVPLESPLSST